MSQKTVNQQTTQYTAPADHESHEQGLKIPNEYSYAVTKRRIYNPMTTITIVDKPGNRKVMIEQHKYRYNIEVNILFH